MSAATERPLHLRNLVKNYGKVAAIDDVSITVEPGEFLTLLGPSGSGKSTILMSIAGFVMPDSGSISVGDEDMTRRPAEKRNFGMVFQGYALFPHMSVHDNVAFPLMVRGVDKAVIAQKVDNALTTVQMDKMSDRFPHEISGGQQQRVALARALVFEPSVLLLDEPLSALDRKLRGELQWELKALHERLRTTFVYVTHDQEEALSMSDRIVILRNGRIVQCATPEEIYNHPKTRFVANFIGGGYHNFLEGVVTGARDGVVEYDCGGVDLRQLLTTATPAPGERVVVSLNVEKISVSPVEPRDAENRVKGVIRSLNYYGSAYHFLVETAALGQLSVRVAALDCELGARKGAEVWLHWSPSASVVVEEDSE